MKLKLQIYMQINDDLFKFVKLYYIYSIWLIFVCELENAFVNININYSQTVHVLLTPVFIWGSRNMHFVLSHHFKYEIGWVSNLVMTWDVSNESQSSESYSLLYMGSVGFRCFTFVLIGWYLFADWKMHLWMPWITHTMSYTFINLLFYLWICHRTCIRHWYRDNKYFSPEYGR